MGLTSPFRDRNAKNQTNCVPAIWDGNGKYQKAFPLFGTGTGITKKLSCSSGRELDTQITLPAVGERALKAFPLGNIQEWEFPLMPVLTYLLPTRYPFITYLSPTCYLLVTFSFPTCFLLIPYLFPTQPLLVPYLFSTSSYRSIPSI